MQSSLCHVKMTDFPCFSVIRELVPPSEMVPSDARQMHMGPHLGPPLPPHANVLPGRGFPGAGEHGPMRFMPEKIPSLTQRNVNEH